MNETPAEPNPTETPAQESPATDAAPKVDVDWKAKAREWENRAKANKSAADELATIKEAQKTEAQKSADRLAAAEKDAVDARRDALRFKIAAKFAIGDEDVDLFLTGNDEETLTRQATRLTARETDRKKQGNFVPKEGNNPKPGGDNEMRDFTRNLFAKDD